jgi:hypothetical protein
MTDTKEAPKTESHAPLSGVSGSFDTHKCSECGGRTALVTGHFYYDSDAEPYNSGIEEVAKAESGDCWVGGYKCDDCEHVQGLWHE